MPAGTAVALKVQAQLDVTNLSREEIYTKVQSITKQANDLGLKPKFELKDSSREVPAKTFLKIPLGKTKTQETQTLYFDVVGKADGVLKFALPFDGGASIVALAQSDDLLHFDSKLAIMAARGNTREVWQIRLDQIQDPSGGS